MKNTPLLSLDNVSLTVGHRKVLDNISLTLCRDEITTIVGPNGAGKSSLVKIVAGIVQPSQGTVQRTNDLAIGYVPQKLSLNQALPMKVSRFVSLADSSKESRAKALSTLEISHLHNTQMHDLSGGELQRVLLARAILRKPNLLLLDEPLQGVDVNGQIELYRLIASLKNSMNCSILMVSHDLHLVMAQTDNVLCLNQHICCHGHPESVSQHPEYIKLFGNAAAKELAIYTHRHDHHHTIHGDAVSCNEGCKHD